MNRYIQMNNLFLLLLDVDLLFLDNKKGILNFCALTLGALIYGLIFGMKIKLRIAWAYNWGRYKWVSGFCGILHKIKK